MNYYGEKFIVKERNSLYWKLFLWWRRRSWCNGLVFARKKPSFSGDSTFSSVTIEVGRDVRKGPNLETNCSLHVFVFHQPYFIFFTCGFIGLIILFFLFKNLISLPLPLFGCYLILACKNFCFWELNVICLTSYYHLSALLVWRKYILLRNYMSF